MNTLEVKKEGLYCKEGDFFIDAWAPVPVSLITHAHGDHAYAGHDLYITTEKSLKLLQHRLGECKIKSYPYKERFKLKNCWISFHPAGHILGSAQIRIETKKGIIVISGDYKRSHDPTCETFEDIPCDLFVTESTFALPIYKWEDSKKIIQAIYDWWQENKKNGFCSILYCYALGKAQRIMSLLAQLTNDKIYVHGAIKPIADIYKSEGIDLISYVTWQEEMKNSFKNELILAPPHAQNSPWLKRFYPYKTAIASGWMQVRGMRKQKNVDRGFILSDHADWNELITTVKNTNAKTILTTHGNAHIFAQYLRENNWDAYSLKGAEVLADEEI